MAVSDILQQVKGFGTEWVCVTGGEPLAQPNCHRLLKYLCDAAYHVSLETSGAIDIGAVDERVSTVMDLKTPASGELEKNLYANLSKLKAKDQIKFVICDRQDYEWAKFKIDEYQLGDKVSNILFSPSYAKLAPVKLAEWILQDKLNVRFQFQLHKYLWGEKPGV